jgi:hypothetical protein
LDVIGTDPVDGAANVARDAVISVEFDQDLGSWQMVPEQFFISDSTGAKVLSTIRYNGGSTLSLQPAASLLPNERYVGTVGTELIAENGAHLAEPYQWSFRTGIESGLVIDSHQSGDVLEGVVQLSGVAAPSIQLVEVSVGYNNYQAAVGATAWEFEIDSTVLDDGATPILVRGLDVSGQYTGETEIVVFIDNDPNAASWHPMQVGPVQSPLSTSWGTAADNVYAVGGSVNDPLAAILHYDGSQWSVVKDDWNFNLRLLGIWGTSADDFYVVGGGISTQGVILHYRSGQWVEERQGAFSDVWGSSASDVYVVGSSGVFHFNGEVWSQLDVGYSNFHFQGVWGNNAEDVYVVGFSGPTDVILHYDGVQWVNQLEGSEFTELFLHDVWGEPNDLYAVGTGRQIIHYDGVSWQTVETGLTLDPLYSVTGASSKVFAISSLYPNTSKIVRFDGTAWRDDKVLNGISLRGIWGNAETGWFAVGSAGVRNSQSVIYHLQPSALAEPQPPVEPDPPPVEPVPQPPSPDPICPALAGCECPPGLVCVAGAQQ